jgi:hypothetical protein
MYISQRWMISYKLQNQNWSYTMKWHTVHYPYSCDYIIFIITVFPHVPYSYTLALEKLSLHSLHTQRHRLDALFLFRPIVALSPVLPSWKMLVIVSLLAMFGTSQRLASVPLTNIALLLGAPMQPTRWVKISTYLRPERFLSIIFYNLVPKIVNNILGSCS